MLLSVVAFIFLGCGDYVCLPAGEVLDGGVSVALANDVDLSNETDLRHFGLDALMRLETVDGAGPFGDRGMDYDSLNASGEATAALSSYLSALATVDPERLETPDERLAFWLNVYNSWVLYAVAGKVAENPEYNVESDEYLIFSSKFIQVNGFAMSPNEVEHGVLRGWVDQPYGDEALAAQAPKWTSDVWGTSPPDARIHMGLNCASASCPALPPGAFRGDRVWDQLDAQAAGFLANTEKGAGPSGVSTLFSWFSGDFVATFGSVEAFVGTYRAEGDEDVDYATFLPYDWSLNAAATPSGEDETCASPW